MSLLTAILCTHNPRPDFLERVLNCLRTQSLSVTHWELLIIDNACEKPLSKRIDIAWHPKARIIRENTLGLTLARLRGIREATGEILVFIDDDNILDANFLAEAVEIAGSYPNIGAWGGQNIPEFEECPAPWTRRYWGMLALREVSSDRWSNFPLVYESTPVGAGLCVLRSVAAYYLSLHDQGKRDIILDRSGPSLCSGGDMDLAACAIDCGLGTGVFKSLRLTHLMPAHRLEEGYLLRLTEGVGFSGAIMDYYRNRPALEQGWSITALIKHLVRLCRMDGRERKFYLADRRGRRRGLKHLAEQLNFAQSSGSEVPREKLTSS
jgi:glycosyltransferase involved in cell wall biosynthesis